MKPTSTKGATPIGHALRDDPRGSARSTSMSKLYRRQKTPQPRRRFPRVLLCKNRSPPAVSGEARAAPKAILRFTNCCVLKRDGGSRSPNVGWGPHVSAGWRRRARKCRKIPDVHCSQWISSNDWMMVGEPISRLSHCSSGPVSSARRVLRRRVRYTFV
jgi:hypothetical protein